MPASGLDEALAAVHSVYQPIVDLRSRLVVANEALARLPAGSGLERPERLFVAAARAGRTAEVDWACRTAAVRGAVKAGVGRDDTLFVNVEPASLGEACPDHLRATHEAAASSLRLVLEITERDLTTDPASLLAVVASARRAGWGVALDDVGAAPASLALMPYLHPDFIKLDRRLVQNPRDSRSAAVVNAVRAQAERTGCTILAEGIESEAQRDRALAMGATLGQGWLFGHPGPPRPTTGETNRFVVDRRRLT